MRDSRGKHYRVYLFIQLDDFQYLPGQGGSLGCTFRYLVQKGQALRSQWLRSQLGYLRQGSARVRRGPQRKGWFRVH